VAEAGWYTDPQDPQVLQFFDGQNWTGQRRPQAAPAAPQQDQTQQFAPQHGAPQQGAPEQGAPKPDVAEQGAQQPGTTPPAFDTQTPWQQPSGAGAGSPAPSAEPDAWQTTRRADLWQGAPEPGPWQAPPQPSTWQGGAPETGQGPQAPAWQGTSETAQTPAWQGTSETAQTPAWQGSSETAQIPAWQGSSETAQLPAWAPAPAAGGWQGQPQPGGWQPPPAAPRKRKRGPIVIALVAVAVVAAGLITWLAWPSDDPPSLTYQGKEINAAGDVLKTTEKNVNALVAERHGAKSADTRCYFAQPTNPASGAKKTDIDDGLRCGPVLFIDGDKNSTYLTVPLTSTGSGSKVTLESQKSLDGISPAAVPTTMKLVRPDGKKAPAGSGGLDVPKPPAAAKDVLAVAPIDASSAPPAIGNARMVGRNTKVTLESAGEVARYGKSDDARSAPAGQKLIAFRVTYGEGAVSGSGSARAQILVDGGTARSVPETSASDDYVIAAVPTSGNAVLQLTDAGYTQTLTLPDGKSGSKNIAVLARNHRTAFIGKTASVPIHLSNGNGSANVTFRASLTFASLDFWIPGHESQHPSSPSRAILSLRLNYTDSSSPGKTYGFDPQILRLKLPSGQVLRARNVASGNKINDVFEVPADYSHGTLQITGSEKVDGVTLKVTKTKTFAVTIPAG
jgi:hypothetical protein